MNRPVLNVHIPIYQHFEAEHKKLLLQSNDLPQWQQCQWSVSNTTYQELTRPDDMKISKRSFIEDQKINTSIQEVGASRNVFGDMQFFFPPAHKTPQKNNLSTEYQGNLHVDLLLMSWWNLC